MKSSNQTAIQQAFTQQAANFESDKMNFFRQDYLGKVIKQIAPAQTDTVLEVAAGTCACSRAMVAQVMHSVCLDMTPAMLAAGRAEAEKTGIRNMTFVLGDAAELPFLDDSFTIVLSRLAFHHFPDVEQVFAEMVRVLEPGGKLALIDMEAAENPLRATADDIEKMRDPSHIRNLSKAEMQTLYRTHGLELTCCETTPMPINLQNWLDHTATPQDVQEQIKSRMAQELHGGPKTGFAPYWLHSQIYFDQRWTLLIGRKKQK